MQLCANKLDKKDFFGKSDPFLVFYRSNEDGTFTICHKTEVVKNTLNPVWQLFTIPVRALCNGDYDSGGCAPLLFMEQWGVRSSALHGAVGGALLCSSWSSGGCAPLLFMEQWGVRSSALHGAVGGVLLCSSWSSGGCAPLLFMEQWGVRSSALHGAVGGALLCSSWSSGGCAPLLFMEQTVKVDVYDWDRDGSHDFIGEFTTSYRELSRGQNQFNIYQVLNPKKKGRKKKYVNSGTVTLLSFKVESEYTFVDFIRGGTQLNFTVAIDFTASNGSPSQPSSLHFLSPYGMNVYGLALRAVGEVLQDYHSHKLFTALGFGAKLPPNGNVSHAFPLNGDSASPTCLGIEGVLEAYFQSLHTVQLYGPTHFAPVINQVANCAAETTDGSQYFVLLMITDGAASLPMSIIIVGVGPAEFDAMEELDGDEVRVSFKGRPAERDIVQFVPFRDYIDRAGNQVLSMARLAKDVLAEIPDQILSFMKTRGIEPRPALSSSPPPDLHRHV
ncbi:hypothetical protein NHX12_012539 [Muraenolepis orangiensis]|uniref:C2 domain-containing protein n=1 Tax=Muraenolepis orangiensis TaxID=630683 RepID=A0A9Q0I604_9TELE|nr:hypothetical protein NHX12_012539 [Muraenolepis orangiensis]